MVEINPETTLVFGDSIAHGTRDAGGMQGNAADGISPGQVLRNVQQFIEANPGALKDRNVILSSGMSNRAEASQKPIIAAQIQALQNAGAHVILLGVSQENTALNPLNGPLGEAARENQAYFVPLTKTGPDHVHPESYSDQLNAVKVAVGDTSVSPKEHAAVKLRSAKQSAQLAVANLPSFWAKPKDEPAPATEAPPPPAATTPAAAAAGKQPSDDGKDGDDNSFKKLFSGDGILGAIGAIFSFVGAIFELIAGNIGGFFSKLLGGFGKSDETGRGGDTAMESGANRGTEAQPPAPAQEGFWAKSARLFRQGETNFENSSMGKALAGAVHSTESWARKEWHEMATTASNAVSFFEGKGWTHEQASGIVANLNRESHLNAHSVGDGNLAKGVAQWHPDRQANFKKRFGHDITQSTVQEQLEFVNYELTQGSERDAGRRLRNAKTATEAGAIVSNFYERPLDLDGKKASLRAADAQQIAILSGNNARGLQLASVETSSAPLPGKSASNQPRLAAL